MQFTMSSCICMISICIYSCFALMMCDGTSTVRDLSLSLAVITLSSIHSQQSMKFALLSLSLCALVLGQNGIFSRVSYALVIGSGPIITMHHCGTCLLKSWPSYIHCLVYNLETCIDFPTFPAPSIRKTAVFSALNLNRYSLPWVGTYKMHCISQKSVEAWTT